VASKKTDALHQIATVPGISPDRYVVANNHDTSGLCLAWVRDKVVAPGEDMSFPDVIGLAASVAPGSGGVIFMPWLTGERSPIDRAGAGPERRQPQVRRDLRRPRPRRHPQGRGP